MNGFRIFHLFLAAAAIAAYLTAEELGLVHAWIGYGVAVLLGLRLLLGLARRRGFDFHRLRLLKPAGGASALAANGFGLLLLASLAGVAGTGIAMDQGGTLVGKSIRADDGESGEGRNESDEAEDFGALSPMTAARADDFGEEGEDGEEEESGLLGEVHEVLGNLLLPLAALHVLTMLALRHSMARFMLFIPRRAG